MKECPRLYREVGLLWFIVAGRVMDLTDVHTIMSRPVICCQGKREFVDVIQDTDFENRLSYSSGINLITWIPKSRGLFITTEYHIRRVREMTVWEDCNSHCWFWKADGSLQGWRRLLDFKCGSSQEPAKQWDFHLTSTSNWILPKFE